MTDSLDPTAGSPRTAPRPTMTAVLVRETGGRGAWNRLELGQVAQPEPGSDQVLVQVAACSVNRADLLQRRGLYPPPPGESTILGLDFAGYVVQKGAAVSTWHVGDRVFGIVAGGGYGRYLAVACEHLLAIPENLSFIEAAAVAEVFLTAYVNLMVEAGLRSGETLLVHGGSGGVGSAAIQLARAFGARVVTTAGGADRRAAAVELGAAAAFDYHADDWPDQVRAATAGQGVDLVLDWIGAPYLSRHLELLKQCGRLVLIGLQGGREAAIDLAPLLGKRLRLIGSVLRSRDRREKARLIAAFRDRVLPLLSRRTVKPIVDRIFPMAEVEAAHNYLKQGGQFGKVVLTWSPQ